MTSLRAWAAAALLLGAALGAGCKQNAGDRCQTQSDCASGLLCILPPGGTPQTGGICTSSDMIPDSGVPDDLSSDDLSTPTFPDLAQSTD